MIQKKYKVKIKKSKRSKKTDRLVQICLILAALVLIFIIYKIFNIVVFNNDNIDLSNEEYYQYFYGIKENYSGKIDVLQNDKETKLQLENGKNIYLDSTPIYYENKLGKAILPQEMELVIPNVGAYKINKFTNVVESNQARYLKKFNKNDMKKTINSFLFDGNDLYFFLEEMTINVSGTEYQISPLSYVIVNYRDNVEIYNYEKDEYIIINEETMLTSDILAINKVANYTINMSVDSISTEKTDELLSVNINNLNELKY